MTTDSFDPKEAVPEPTTAFPSGSGTRVKVKPYRNSVPSQMTAWGVAERTCHPEIFILGRIRSRVWDGPFGR